VEARGEYGQDGWIGTGTYRATIGVLGHRLIWICVRGGVGDGIFRIVGGVLVHSLSVRLLRVGLVLSLEVISLRIGSLLILRMEMVLNTLSNAAEDRTAMERVSEQGLAKGRWASKGRGEGRSEGRGREGLRELWEWLVIIFVLVFMVVFVLILVLVVVLVNDVEQVEGIVAVWG